MDLGTISKNIANVALGFYRSWANVIYVWCVCTYVCTWCMYVEDLHVNTAKVTCFSVMWGNVEVHLLN